jgi:hypothetical protein
VPPIILLRSSTSAMGGTCRAATGSAIPSRPIGRKASATTIWCYSRPYCR